MARDYPAFLFYPEDFESGTAEMSNSEVGMYMRLLCHQWHKLFVPDDPVRVAFITRSTPAEMTASWEVVRAKFKECGNGQLKNQKLEKIRRELKESKRRRSVSGKLGADARWGDGKQDGKPNGKRMAKPKQTDGENMASRVGDVNVDALVTASAIATGFEDFWGVVPHKVGRAAAQKAYAAAAKLLVDRGTKDPHGLLLTRMKIFAASAIGRGDPQYCPHPSTWLNKGRYDDDPATWNRRHDPRGTFSAGEKFLQSDFPDEDQHGK